MTDRESLRKIAHALGVCHCSDSGCEPGPMGEIMERIARLDRMQQAFIDARVTRPLSEWHDDDGAALWWRFPIVEPPYVGTPGDSDWPGYHTHWTAVVEPFEPFGEEPSR